MDPGAPGDGGQPGLGLGDADQLSVAALTPADTRLFIHRAAREF